MYYVYILKSEKDGRLYKGMTVDMGKRVRQHNKGQNKSTKGFCPWILVHHETFKTRVKAREREKFFKSGVGREYLKANRCLFRLALFAKGSALGKGAANPFAITEQKVLSSGKTFFDSSLVLVGL